MYLTICVLLVHEIQKAKDTECYWDTKEDNESCKSRDRQYSGQRKKGKKTNKQKTIYKILHRKLRSSNMNPTKNQVCTQVRRISMSGSTCGIRRVAPVTNR